MSKWISADALVADLKKGLWGKAWDKALAEAIIRDAPSIDIVRCKECKWYGRRNKARFYRGTDCLRIGGIGTTTPDSFCSYGERSE